MLPDPEKPYTSRLLVIVWRRGRLEQVLELLESILVCKVNEYRRDSAHFFQPSV